MALWLARAGKHGQHEQRFLDEGRIYLTWSGLDRDLSGLESRDELKKLLEEVYPESGEGRIQNHASQIWQFAGRMSIGDWVVLPSKMKRAIHVARIEGPYNFIEDGEDPYHHYRAVTWLAQDIPRSHFGQDLLYSFGAFLSICRVKRNNAEQRLHSMAERGWTPEDATTGLVAAGDEDEDELEATAEALDLELLARDAIAKLVSQRFKGYPMERLVESILQAKGYTTHRTPEGSDKGIDILAASGPLGFDHPRICVQVKSGDTPLDHPTLSQLIGTMQNVQADHGLLVSWGGFRRSVESEVAQQFFRVRLWDQDELLDELLRHYDQLDESIQSELPLRRIWTVASPEG